jgi:hypothetical protein
MSATHSRVPWLLHLKEQLQCRGQRKVFVDGFEKKPHRFMHRLYNRQMCEAATVLTGAADETISLEMATCFHLGDEAGVKAAIHTLIVSARAPNAPACVVHNAALVVFLLLVRLTPAGQLSDDVGERWRWHFRTRSDYAVVMLTAGERLLEARPVGEAMFRLGLMLLDIASALEAPPDRKAALTLALKLLREHSVRSPKHPYVKYVLAKAMALAGEPSAEVLRMYEESTLANPTVGLMEAAALLMDQDRVSEAFAKMEQQVAVDPMLAYGQWALLLFFRLDRLMKTKGKELKGKELRKALEDVKRNNEVSVQLAQVIAPNPRARLLDWDTFSAFEQSLALPPPNHNRVEFVPRVDENPFVDADFEKDFL